MSNLKPLASLSSGLLARKGGAKPAMRRQGMAFPDQEHAETQDNDLGWNDMGYDVDPDHNAPSDDEKGPLDGEHVNRNPLAGAIPDAIPAVKQQQDEIAAKLSENVEALEPEETGDLADDSASEPLSFSPEVAPLEPRSAIVKNEIKPAAAKKSPAKAKKSRTRKAKAAFTLRLDPERHLKLRLATAVKNVSAQQLVTKAVDEYLSKIPELDDLASRIPTRGAA